MVTRLVDEHLCRVKTIMIAVLTVMSDLDPHMDRMVVWLDHSGGIVIWDLVG